MLQAICSDASVNEGSKSADHDLLLISEEVSLHMVTWGIQNYESGLTVGSSA